jgi:hypothetical protein
MGSGGSCLLSVVGCQAGDRHDGQPTRTAQIYRKGLALNLSDKVRPEEPSLRPELLAGLATGVAHLMYDNLIPINPNDHAERQLGQHQVPIWAFTLRVCRVSLKVRDATFPSINEPLCTLWVDRVLV